MKTLYYLLGITAIALFLSCEKELEVYQAGARLSFYYAAASDTLVSYSFVYGPSTTTQDTVWLEMETIGELSATNRSISVEQVSTGINDALPHVHYVAFDDASLQNAYMMPAGRSRTRIPIVLKRDASLQSKRMTLLVQIKHNEIFPLSYSSRDQVKIVFSDLLEKPTNWNATFVNPNGTILVIFPLGEWGAVKHRFLIEQTGEKWDYDYIHDVLGFNESPTTYAENFNVNYDNAYCSFLVTVMRQRLSEYNAVRQAQGLDVLKEADGTVVSF